MTPEEFENLLSEEQEKYRRRLRAADLFFYGGILAFAAFTFFAVFSR